MCTLVAECLKEIPYNCNVFSFIQESRHKLVEKHVFIAICNKGISSLISFLHLSPSTIRIKVKMYFKISLKICIGIHYNLRVKEYV